MVRTTSQELELRDIFRVIVRHRWKAMTFFLLAMTVATAWTLTLPTEYRSEAKLYFRLGRENATIEPTATMGRGAVVNVPHSRDKDINTSVEILTSRVIADAVVDEMGPATILAADSESANDSGPGELSASSRLKGSVTAAWAGVTQRVKSWLGRPEDEQGPTNDRDEAIAWLQDHLDVKPARNSNILLVACQGPCPEIAQAVTTEVIDAFLDEHVHINRTEGAHEFFVEQTDGSRDQLIAAEKKLRDLKIASGIADPDEQRRLIAERVAGLEDELALTTRDIAAAKAKIERLQASMETLPEREIAQETDGIGHGATDSMRAQLYDLQVREKELASKYTEDHPLLEQIRQQVADAKEVHSREDPTRRHVTTAPDRAYETGELELIRDVPELASLESRATALQTQLADACNQLKTFIENAARINELEREIELKEVDYQTYAKNLEQSRIDHAMETQRISNISVAQPATYAIEPVRRRIWLILVAGIAVGLVGGVSLALFAEYLDHSLKTPEDIEEKLELPALISVPRLKSQAMVLAGNGNGNGHGNGNGRS